MARPRTYTKKGGWEKRVGRTDPTEAGTADVKALALQFLVDTPDAPDPATQRLRLEGLRLLLDTIKAEDQVEHDDAIVGFLTRNMD